MESKTMLMEQPRVEERPTGCSNCASTSLFFDPIRSELVCDRCGFVLGTQPVDPGPDWSPFEAGAARAGPPETVLLADGGLGNTMGAGGRDAAGRSLSANESARFGRLRRVSQWTRLRGTERSLTGALGTVNRIASGLSLPQDFRERSAVILRKALKADLARGRSMDAIVAASVYLAARALGAPRSLQEVAEVAEITVHRLAATAKLVARETRITTMPPRPQDFVSRFASELGVAPETTERAFGLIAERKEELAMAPPLGAAAGALYLAAELGGEKLKQSDVSRVAGVSEVTLRKYYKLLKASAPAVPAEAA
ncbi:MAG TPA: TFIIB-type zinc ribbon-containing protein [Thermoplasmata archaeon]|nr:TFIIB-type zinc ribbon-containing protein [Thermoplasmata archaeon]